MRLIFRNPDRVGRLVGRGSKAAVGGEGDLETSQVFSARNHRGAHSEHVGGGLLNIEQSEAPFAKVGDQINQSDFRGIGDEREHRFAREEPPDGDSVKTAYQRASLPNFHRMSVAGTVQIRIRRSESIGDPGCRAIGCGCRAALDHPIEVGVKTDLKLTPSENFPETPGHVKIIKLENGSRVGAKPGGEIIIKDGPGKNALPISEDQSFDREISADGHESIWIGGDLRVRKTESVSKDHYHW